MDEKKRKMWLEAEANPQFHIAGDPEGASWKPRIYGDMLSFMEAPIAYGPEDLEGADGVFLHSREGELLD